MRAISGLNVQYVSSTHKTTKIATSGKKKDIYSKVFYYEH
jgi:hypothetical protein